MPALRLRGSLKAVTAVGDGLDAGEGGGAAGEGVQEQEDGDGLRLADVIHRRRVGDAAERPRPAGGRAPTPTVTAVMTMKK